jgi:hypothetical protein
VALGTFIILFTVGAALLWLVVTGLAAVVARVVPKRSGQGR